MSQISRGWLLDTSSDRCIPAGILITRRRALPTDPDAPRTTAASVLAMKCLSSMCDRRPHVLSIHMTPAAYPFARSRAPDRGRYIDAAWYPRQTQTRASANVADCTWPAQ